MTAGLGERAPLLGRAGPLRPTSPAPAPPRALTRAAALLLTSLVGFGAFFCFDSPGALESELGAGLGLGPADLSALYAWYSWPNVLLPGLAGVTMDRVLGVKRSTVLLAALLLLGQVTRLSTVQLYCTVHCSW